MKHEKFKMCIRDRFISFPAASAKFIGTLSILRLSETLPRFVAAYAYEILPTTDAGPLIPVSYTHLVYTFYSAFKRNVICSEKIVYGMVSSDLFKH